MTAVPIRARRVDPVVLATAGVITVLVLAAVLAPVLPVADPDAVDLAYPYAGPSAAHPLGTDGSGRDLLARLVYGARSGLLGPLIVVLLATLTGTAVAVAAAWRGGWVDAVVSRVCDVLFAFPSLLLAMLAVSLFGSGLLPGAIALAVGSTPYIMRITRAVALRECGQTYIAALVVQGQSGVRICVRHVVPVLLPFILSQATISFGYATVNMSALSFLGLGVQPPTADWGAMVSTGQTGLIRGEPLEAILAAGVIALAVASFTVLGERLLAAAENHPHR
ncbi:ABC transporter permease [Streptosporangium sp. NPDC051022]|uniref:ABC transporter permease n=1 Tax=Streptosporangium sp. NPDC051022 TaxID=3155752 RepID=UPI003418C664